MGLSSIAIEQREKEEKALRSFLAFSLIGSVVLHIAVLAISSLWVRTPELAEEPIEVMVVDPPSLQAAKPQEKTKSKGGSVASGSETKSQSGSGAAGGSSIRGGSRGGGTSGTRYTLPSQPKASTTGSDKGDAIASIAPSGQQPTPVQTTTTQPPVETLKPKLEPTPKPAETLPPVPTLPPKPEFSPKPAATLPPEQASAQPVSTPSPSPTATLEPKPSSQPTPVPVAQSPSPPAAPTQPPPARQQVAKIRDLFRGQTSSTSQEIAGNGARQSDKPRGVDDRSSVAAGSGNRHSGSTRGSGTRDSRQSTGSGNGSGSGSGTGSGSGSGSGSGTGSGNGSGSGSGTGGNGSGFGRVACRSCPDPEYPPGAEKLEGRAVVVINVDRDGNVRNVQIDKSTSHDILDQRALETVKKWKFTSSENGWRKKVVVNFGQRGSEFYRQARERKRQALKRERQARELEQNRKRERQAREEQQRKRERQAREVQQRKRELLNRQTPAPVPETREKPTTPTAPMPEYTTIPEASPQPVTPEPAPSPPEPASL